MQPFSPPPHHKLKDFAPSQKNTQSPLQMPKTTNKQRTQPARRAARKTTRICNAETQTARPDALCDELSGSEDRTVVERVVRRRTEATTSTERAKRKRDNDHSDESVLEEASSEDCGIAFSAPEWPWDESDPKQKRSKKSKTLCAEFATEQELLNLTVKICAAIENDPKSLSAIHIDGFSTPITKHAKKVALRVFMNEHNDGPFEDWAELCLFLKNFPKTEVARDALASAHVFQQQAIVAYANKAAAVKSRGLEGILRPGDLHATVLLAPGTKHFSARKKAFVTGSGSNQHRYLKTRLLILHRLMGTKSSPKPSKTTRAPSAWDLALMAEPSVDASAVLEQFKIAKQAGTFESARRALLHRPKTCKEHICQKDWDEAVRQENAEASNFERVTLRHRFTALGNEERQTDVIECKEVKQKHDCSANESTIKHEGAALHDNGAGEFDARSCVVGDGEAYAQPNPEIDFSDDEDWAQVIQLLLNIDEDDNIA